MQGPELRTIFLGMDQSRDELLYSNVKGKNPFKDKRVRQAFYQAIDIEAIKSRIMRGAATPTNLMVGAGDQGLRPGPQRAPALRRGGREEAAGRKPAIRTASRSGMNCPNDRYVNDCGDLPGDRGDAGADRRQGEPQRRDQGHLFPQDPVAQHVVLHAGLDADDLRFAQSAAAADDDARGQGRAGPVQPRQLQQQARSTS